LNRAFKVIQGYILTCAGRIPERFIVVMWIINADDISETYEDGNGNTANSPISTTTLKFEDVSARNAFEYLQMIYIARN